MADKGIHEEMERVYEAARLGGLIPPHHHQTMLARELNVAPQLVNNWEKRGPSAEGLLTIQAKFGINASWVKTGTGPKFVGHQPNLPYPPPAPAVSIGVRESTRDAWPLEGVMTAAQFYETLTELDRRDIMNFARGLLSARLRDLHKSTGT